MKLSFPGEYSSKGSRYIVSIYRTLQMLSGESTAHLNKEQALFWQSIESAGDNTFCMEMAFT
jgi:hypothetical protein